MDRGAFVVEVSGQVVAEIASIRLRIEPYAGELSMDVLRGREPTPSSPSSPPTSTRQLTRRSETR